MYSERGSRRAGGSVDEDEEDGIGGVGVGSGLLGEETKRMRRMSPEGLKT